MTKFEKILLGEVEITKICDTASINVIEGKFFLMHLKISAIDRLFHWLGCLSFNNCMAQLVWYFGGNNAERLVAGMDRVIFLTVILMSIGDDKRFCLCIDCN